ncbi:probable helicase senataxin isoform X2 [Denticeps clupeoides]|uniref:Senataxin n=1 Tax=Denticeps clupeoides TaxID=299321 RepID=A0AAY4A321_9TELE|nr:probable helicase senataxin isoform X2 [Denticeps clupeoides]
METCLWCRSARERLPQLLEQYATGVLSAEDQKGANDDLNICEECMLEYHRARSKVPHLHKRLWELETARLLGYLSFLSEVNDDLLMVEDDLEKCVPEITAEQYRIKIHTPLTEMLQYPYLMMDRKLSEMCVEALCNMEKNSSFGVNEKHPGIYLLLVHPNETVRRWAVTTARSQGKVNRDDFYDLEEVLCCIFYVIELGISLKLPESDSTPAYDGKLFRLPPHLYDSSNVKNYWLGICMLLTLLDAQAMDSLFLGPTRQADILQCILNTMEEECNSGSDPFWPALQCFMVILDCLGARTWGHIEPNKAFQIITGSSSYTTELESIQNRLVAVKVEDHENDLTFSQMVYDTYVSGKKNQASRSRGRRTEVCDGQLFAEMSCLVNILQTDLGREMHKYNSTFLWFIPFVRSIVGMAHYTVIYMLQVVNYLCSKISSDLLSGRTATCDKVSEFFVFILVHVVELHLTGGCMQVFKYCPMNWAGMIVQCAVLPADTVCGRWVQEYNVSGNSSSLPHACIKVIRALLKEGGRLGSKADPRAAHYLNLLNKHLRDATSQQWNLTSFEIRDLQNCLKKLVEAMTENSSAVPTSNLFLSAPPTPPAEPPEHVVSMTAELPQTSRACEQVAVPSFIKEEPLWDCGHSPQAREQLDSPTHQDFIKKEPQSMVPISLVSGKSELNSFKPDPRRLQVIQSCLIDRLPKLQAIAVNKPDGLDPQIVSSAEPGNKSNSLLGQKCSPGEAGDNEPLNVLRKRLVRGKISDVNADKKIYVKDLVEQSNVIIISDDEICGDKMDKECPDGNPFQMAKCSENYHNLKESPSRDFDGDLSESQVFEFETQEFVASAWAESHLDSSVSIQKSKKEPLHSRATSCDSETELVPDEDIEQACLQVEEQVRQQQKEQNMSHPNSSSLLLPPSSHQSSSKSACSHRSSTEKHVEFTKPQPHPNKSLSVKVSSGEKKLGGAKIPPIIEPSACKVKRTKKSSNVPQRNNAFNKTSAFPLLPCSSSSLHPPVPPSTPAIVPPKKVRKRQEPESTVERLGLKKTKRKAFDLSQRTRDSVEQLRLYGQAVHLEGPPKKHCRVTKLTSPQKMRPKKKLLASQEMQYFRQSRGRPQLTAAAGASIPVVQTNKCKNVSQTAVKDVEKQDMEDEEEDLPCSQPDPGLRPSVEQIKGTVTKTFCQPRGVPIEEDQHSNGSLTSKYFSQKNDPNNRTETMNNWDDEWMTLTQAEPTDMELCSQMEEFENENDQLLTQNDPVDMDLESQSDAERDVQNGALSVEAATSSSTSATTVRRLSVDLRVTPLMHQSDNEVFLKPGMSPMTSKAKPSTVKMYAPSSRNATLVQEMEKATKTVAAAKTRPACQSNTLSVVKPVTAPQAMFKQPLPPKILPRPPAQAPRSVQQSSSTTSSHQQPYTSKTHPRPETSSVPVANTTKDCKLFLMPIVLSWRYSFFENYKQFGTPKNLCNLPLKQVPTSFSSYDEYFNTFFPLLLTNTFEELVDDFLRDPKIDLNLQLNGIDYNRQNIFDSHSPTIANASFKVKLSSKQESQQLYPKEDDFVILWLPSNTGMYSHVHCADEQELPDAQPHFGWVSCSNVYHSGSGPLLNVSVQTRGNVSSVNAQSVRCQVVGNLVNAVRELRALCQLRHLSTNRPLLAPERRLDHFLPGSNTVPDITDTEYNPDQAKAIACAVSMITCEHHSPKICLIHGPPGTGKSRTIVGLIHRLFTQAAAVPPAGRASKHRMRVLLCAPSNAAIDCLMKKLIIHFKEKCRDRKKPQGNCGDINLIRLGNERTIAKGLKDFSLDSRTQKVQHTQDGHRKKAELDDCIENLAQMCAVTDKNTDQANILKQETQHRLLQEANVICCTLSSSGNMKIESAFRNLGQVPFSCVIVDEAGQATEPESLIPLLFKSPSLILVGDPEQLPPTVVSQQVKELGYDQSLMARLLKSLNQKIPISFLSHQYRMHPDICQFPSKYIYNSMLKNDREVAQMRFSPNWPFQPYRVFDVMDGREIKDRESFSNPKEVTLIQTLVRLISEKNAYRIGIITPYSAQKRRIQQALSEFSNGEMVQQQVEVDTVDGFQGREMECIIVSCVRASSGMGSIGFVGNRQRMNVTITRAKYSLFILGHLRTLKEHSDWAALIEDAENRGTIVKTQERTFSADAKNIFKQVHSSHNPLYNHEPRPSGRPAFSRSTSDPHLSSTRLQPSEDHPRDPRLAGRLCDQSQSRTLLVRDQRVVRRDGHPQERRQWAPQGANRVQPHAQRLSPSRSTHHRRFSHDHLPVKKHR